MSSVGLMETRLYFRRFPHYAKLTVPASRFATRLTRCLQTNLPPANHPAQSLSNPCKILLSSVASQ